MKRLVLAAAFAFLSAFAALPASASQDSCHTLSVGGNVESFCPYVVADKHRKSALNQGCVELAFAGEIARPVYCPVDVMMGARRVTASAAPTTTGSDSDSNGGNNGNTGGATGGTGGDTDTGGTAGGTSSDAGASGGSAGETAGGSAGGTAGGVSSDSGASGGTAGGSAGGTAGGVSDGNNSSASGTN